TGDMCPAFPVPTHLPVRVLFVPRKEHLFLLLLRTEALAEADLAARCDHEPTHPVLQRRMQTFETIHLLDLSELHAPAAIDGIQVSHEVTPLPRTASMDWTE